MQTKQLKTPQTLDMLLKNFEPGKQQSLDW